MRVPLSSTGRATCQPAPDSQLTGLALQGQTQTRRRRMCRRRAWPDNTPLLLAYTSTLTRCPGTSPTCRSSLEWAALALHRECPLQPAFYWRTLWHPRRCSQSPAPIAAALLGRIPADGRVKSRSFLDSGARGRDYGWGWRVNIPVGTGIRLLPRSCS